MRPPHAFDTLSSSIRAWRKRTPTWDWRKGCRAGRGGAGELPASTRAQASYEPALKRRWPSAYADTGDFAGAERCFRQVAAIDRDSPQACAGLSRLRKMTPRDSDWLGDAQRIAALPLPPRQEACLRYAMGKYFDDIADFEHAFDNFRRRQRAHQMHPPRAPARGDDADR